MSDAESARAARSEAADAADVAGAADAVGPAEGTGAAGTAEPAADTTPSPTEGCTPEPPGGDPPPAPAVGAEVTGQGTADMQTPVPDPPQAPRRTRLLLTVAVCGFLLDLVTKLIVVETLNGRPPLELLGGAVYFTEIRNTGAAWGLVEGMTLLLTAVAVVVVVVILRTARRLRSTPWAWALGGVLAGAMGNLVDRIFRSPGFLRGGVVDFVSLFDPYGRVWPIFNVADSALVCGGVCAVLLALLGFEFDGTRHRKGEAGETGDGSGRSRGAGD